MSKQKYRYWVVGASMLSGTQNVDTDFVENGFWALGYSKDGDETQYKLAQEIKKGDRIAIKRRMGQGSSDIKIFHIGIVTGVVQDFSSQVVCTVNWIVKNKDLEVESKGCYKTVHGPYTRNKEYSSWIDQIFSL